MNPLEIQGIYIYQVFYVFHNKYIDVYQLYAISIGKESFFNASSFCLSSILMVTIFLFLYLPNLCYVTTGDNSFFYTPKISLSCFFLVSFYIVVLPRLSSFTVGESSFRRTLELSMSCIPWFIIHYIDLLSLSTFTAGHDSFESLRSLSLTSCFCKYL